jgi:hypothetical protein
MDKDLMAQYGEACVNLEIAQNQHLELKKKVAEMLNKKPEVKAVEPVKE